MSLEDANRNREDLTWARTEIIRLRLEVTRLEHALTTAELLEVLLNPPKKEAIINEYLHELTPREKEVLLRIMAGDSSDEMAKSLYLSLSTIKTYIARIYDKLGVHNRGGATMAGINLGLIIPEDDKKE